jgi:hypothetical protein
VLAISAPQVLAGLRNLAVGALHAAGRTKIAASPRWTSATPPEPLTSSASRMTRPNPSRHDFVYSLGLAPVLVGELGYQQISKVLCRVGAELVVAVAGHQR